MATLGSNRGSFVLDVRYWREGHEDKSAFLRGDRRAPILESVLEINDPARPTSESRKMGEAEATEFFRALDDTSLRIQRALKVWSLRRAPQDPANSPPLNP